jgi:hypothetical protein
MRALIRAIADTAGLAPRDLVTHRGFTYDDLAIPGLTANEISAARRLCDAYLAACENEGVATYPNEPGWHRPLSEDEATALQLEAEADQERADVELGPAGRG